MSDTETTALIERGRLAMTCAMFAAAHEAEAAANGDQRLIAAADSLKRIDATSHMIGDDVLLKLSSVDDTSHGLLWGLITARLSQVGFALPCYVNAQEFLAPIEATVDDILKRARAHMH